MSENASLGADLDNYKYGFRDDEDYVFKSRKGLDHEIVEEISWMKGEPGWMRALRHKALDVFFAKPVPTWGADLSKLDYGDIYYYVKPVEEQGRSWDEVPEGIRRTFDRLGIPEAERKFLAGAGAQYESEAVYHNLKEEWERLGVIFVDSDTGLREHEEFYKEYFGTVVPAADNKYAALNTAVWSGGSFVYIPPGVKVDIPLQAYFRINAQNMGQFERTLIVADEGASVSYLEGCTAPMRDEHQLHAAVVELIALDSAQIKYSTVQNWYPGNKEGKGGIYNFVTKRGKCKGVNSKISWTQVETGSAITWKYPSCLLMGDNSVGEFYSVALTNNYQQADTGTKMIHIGKNTRSTIVSKGISAGHGQNTYRGMVKIMKNAERARNYSRCDSLLIGSQCGAHTFPYIEVKNSTAQMEHEASTSKIGEDQLFYCQQRGIPAEAAVSMIVNGFCKEVFRELPMEFAVEAQKLLGVSLEGSVG